MVFFVGKGKRNEGKEEMSLVRKECSELGASGVRVETRVAGRVMGHRQAMWCGGWLSRASQVAAEALVLVV